jgi:predicted RNA-binding protein Jag
MEQGSTIIKAIEKAWVRAEKPKEFSIKIFEQEEKNFFGMNTKQAKIGIFFEDKNTTTHEKPVVKARPEVREQRPEAREPQQRPAQTQKAAPHVKPLPRTEQPKPAAPKINQPRRTEPMQEQPKVEQPRRAPAVWNDEMINATQSWLKKTLSLMGMTTITFSQEISGKNLKLTFNTPLIEDIMHEKMLFRSFAHLIMASLRNQYKQEIKDLKVILIRPE